MQLHRLNTVSRGSQIQLNSVRSGFTKGLKGWGEMLPEDKKYATDSYVDPESGRTTVDVSDLGISMGDLGKKGWASPENVHPQVMSNLLSIGCSAILESGLRTLALHGSVQ